MTASALCNARIFDGRGFLDGHAVLIEGSRVAGVAPEADVPAHTPRRDLGGALLLPGFIDVQVNGGGGVLFNDAPTVETIRKIGAAHRRFGTTGFLPTLISDDLEVVDAALRAVEDGMRAGVPGLLGVHLEGPFLNPERKGVHDPAKFLVLTERHLERVRPLARGVTLITVAPEQTAPGMIRRLSDSGFIVSLGHSNAGYAQARAAFGEGARGVTHLFNAMPPLSAREPGVAGAALEDEAVWCGVIADGRHVSPAMLKIAFRVKPPEKFILVTDAMPTVGMSEKSFILQGRRITVKDGVCMTEDGTLAGSDLDMASAVRNCAALTGVGLAAAVNMASLNPASFLGLDRELGRIAAGCRANLAAADDNLQILETWVDGVPSAEGSVADPSS